MVNLRQAASEGARKVVTDAANGFAWPVDLVAPDGTTYSLDTLTNDIAELIDPETGTAVSGRRATAVFAGGALRDAGATGVEGVRDTAKRPWLVKFSPTSGGTKIPFKIFETAPDNQMDLLACYVEAYNDGG